MKQILKDLAFLGYILIAGLAASVLVMCIVPVLYCIVTGTPLYH